MSKELQSYKLLSVAVTGSRILVSTSLITVRGVFLMVYVFCCAYVRLLLSAERIEG